MEVLQRQGRCHANQTLSLVCIVTARQSVVEAVRLETEQVEMYGDASALNMDSKTKRDNGTQVAGPHVGSARDEGQTSEEGSNRAKDRG